MKRNLFLKKVKILLSLFLLFGVFVATAQSQKTITGIVLSAEDNSPLPGATVLEKGTSNGTSTDFDGNFSLNVGEDATTLIVSFVGYGTKEVGIVNLDHVNITLQEDSNALDEVVVTALGIKREEKALGYAVQEVAGENLTVVSGLDVATSLTGKIAGLLVRNSSDFGAVPDVTIRGGNPLIVIDGIPYANKTVSDISSEDIETLTVLKGATASALYGFRGGDGAILIVTKNGSEGAEGVSVDFATNTMFSAGFLAIPEKQAVYGRGSNGKYNKNSTASWGPAMDGTVREQWDPNLMEYRDYEYLPVGKNNFENFLEQGYLTNNNVNVGYKGENSSIRSSVNWTQNKGQYPNSVQNKYTYSLGGDFTHNKFNLSSNVAYSKKQTPNLGSNGYTSYDPMYSLLIWSASDYNVLDYKDNYWLKEHEIQNHTYRRSVNNPYFDRYEKTNEVSRDIFNADLTMNYDISDWLKATVRSGLDFYTDRGQLRTSKGSFVSTGNTGIPGQGYSWNGTRVGGYNLGQTQGYSMNNDLLFTGDKSFSDDRFGVEYLVGGSIFYKESNNVLASTVGGLLVPNFFSINASVEPAKVGEVSKKQQVNSIYGRLAFSWNNMFYVEATGRNDWNSTLSEKNRSIFYPSVSGSFVVSEILPEATKDWLNLLKVRASWTTGIEPPNIFDANQSRVFTIRPGTWNDDNGASAPTFLYPEDINYATTSTYEAGLQGIFFKKRLTFDFTYFNKNTFDRLIKGNVTSASGYNKAFVNTKEETSARGWEVSMSVTPIKKDNVQWDIGLNGTGFNTIYTKLDPLYTPVRPWIKVGERVDALNSREFRRDPASGQLIYYNGRIKKSQYDTNFGWTDPDFIWGVNTNLRYKNFSLYLSFDGVSGGLMNTRTESYMWQSGGHPDSLTDIRALDVADPGSKNYIGEGVMIVSGEVTYDQVGNITSDTRVFAPNTVASTYQRAVKDLHASSAWGGNGTRPDTYSKTFFKLREMSITYNVPTTLLNKWAKAASVSFVGQNVLLWAKDFKYSDPDGGSKFSGSKISTGEDFSDPSVRYLGANIKLTF